MIVEKILGEINNYDKKNKELDYIYLDHFDMEKPHQKLKSENGLIIPISLEQGKTLKDGDVVFENETTIVVIESVVEDIIEVKPKNITEWARAAFNIGNMHQKAYVYEDCIRIPYDYVMEQLLNSLGVEIERKKEKLNGIKAGVTVKEHGSGHNHEHGHSHGDSHSHESSHSHGHSHEQ